MAELRRGLPRVPGGEPWPPSTVVVEQIVATPGVVNEGVVNEVVAPAATAAAPVVSPRPSGEPGAFRRGLPRVTAGEPWPPASAVPGFAVAVPASPVDAAPVIVEPAATPAQAAPAATPAHPAPAHPAPAAEAAPARRAALPIPAASPAAVPPAPTAPAKPRRERRFTADQVFGGLTALVAGGMMLLVAGTAVVFLIRWFLFQTPVGVGFLAAFPGTSKLPDWAPVGQPLWAQWQHWLNAFFLILLIKTGLTVRRTTRPAAMWQPRRGGKKISIELFTHLVLDVLWVVNGVVFWVLLFATGQWVRVVPISWDVIPNAVSAALQYGSLSWPTEDGWVNYNSLQLLAYFVTIFLAAPLAAITGLRMSPLWPANATRLNKAYPVELARRLHFPVMLYFVAFIAVHVILVLATGALRNLNHMFWGSDDPGDWIGFWVFLLGIVAIIGGWIAARPAVTKYLGAAFGKVGR